MTTTSDNLAIMDTFVNQEIVITTHTDYVGQPSLRLTGTLRESPSLSGLYHVQIGERLTFDRFDFRIGNVEEAWRAASGRIVRVKF